MKDDTLILYFWQRIVTLGIEEKGEIYGKQKRGGEEDKDSWGVNQR